MKNHAELLSAILAVRFDFLRVNDVELSEDLYNIDFYTAKNAAGVEYDGVCLMNPKRDEFSVSEHQLAGLRMAKGPITAQWLDEFYDDNNSGRFKNWLVERLVSEPHLDLKDIRLKAVAQIRVRNQYVVTPNTPVYHDKCYLGALAFSKAVMNLTKGHAGDRKFFASSEYRLGMSEHRATLHASGIDPLKPLVEVKLPIFTVV